MSDFFVNPYTFVPLPRNGKKTSDITEITEPVFSGEIKCRLTTKTQIAVPDKLKNPLPNEDERTEPKKYDFFTLDGKAAIPGSGIRGVIRSVYEVLTDSCMHLNDKDDDYFHTRVNKTKPGIITFDPASEKYTLYKAERFTDKTNSNYKTGEIVYFTYKDLEKKENTKDTKQQKYKPCQTVDQFFDSPCTGSKIGVYLRVNPFPSKDKNGKTHWSSPSVFVKNGDGEEIKEVYIKRLITNVELYKGDYKEDYQKAIEKMETAGGWLPVWYWQDIATGHYYLAPSQYSRAVFVKKPRDIVERARMEACTSPKNCCAACALFGFIADGKGDSQSRASRVRFTDAICDDKDCFDGSYLLPVLAEPRLSSFEFYLSGNEKTSLGPDNMNVTIAGRKFYWHAPQNVITKDDEFAKEQPKMAARMQLVRKGAEFTFSVFFDRITDDQLKKLVFALDLGENYAGSARCHKIGHGKPVGLGSVKITVEKVTKRSFADGIYSVSDVTEETVGAANQGMFQPTPEFSAFITKVVNLNYAAKKDVDYPRETNGGDIFKWFADNRGSLRSEGYIKLNNHLPRITDADQSLPRMPKSEQKGGYNNGNRNSGYNRGGSNYRSYR